MGINRRSGHGFQSLKLSAGWDEEALHDVIEQPQWDDNGREIRHPNADDHYGRGDLEETVEPQAEIHRDDSVHVVDVLAESVDDASERSRVEKGHWSTHDPLQHAFMLLSTGVDLPGGRGQ